MTRVEIFLSLHTCCGVFFVGDIFWWLAFFVFILLGPLRYLFFFTDLNDIMSCGFQKIELCFPDICKVEPTYDFISYIVVQLVS